MTNRDLDEAERKCRSGRPLTTNKPLTLVMDEYDRRGHELDSYKAVTARLRAELSAATAKFADCGLCRRRMFIELNSRCAQHRNRDDQSW